MQVLIHNEITISNPICSIYLTTLVHHVADPQTSTPLFSSVLKSLPDFTAYLI